MSEVHTCCSKIYSNYGSYTCGKKAKFERNGKHYCGMHDPVTRKEKAAKQEEKWRAQWDAKSKEREVPANRIKELESEVAALREKLALIVTTLEIARTDKDGVKYDFIQTRSGSMLNVSTAIQQSKDSAQGEKKC